MFDPLHAERSLDIGKFYLNKGAYDAAIDRFVESSNYQPALAMPWKFLGEAYEKKHDTPRPSSPTINISKFSRTPQTPPKIKKPISDLEEKSAQESPKKAERQ